MLNIHKNREPKSLTEHRCHTDACYENMPKQARKELKDALLTEQGYICAYCMARISEDTMKVEHVASRKEVPTRQLDYSNLVACCLGKEGAPRNQQHCDTYKEDSSLSKNPANIADRVEECIEYEQSTGRVYSTHASFNNEIDTLLHLNTPSVRLNRDAVWRAVRNYMAKHIPKQASAEVIQRILAPWEELDRYGRHREYAGIVRFFLKKRLKRATL